LDSVEEEDEEDDIKQWDRHTSTPPACRTISTAQAKMIIDVQCASPSPTLFTRLVLVQGLTGTPQFGDCRSSRSHLVSPSISRLPPLAPTLTCKSPVEAARGWEGGADPLEAGLRRTSSPPSTNKKAPFQETVGTMVGG
jgi:hypothetical protein